MNAIIFLLTQALCPVESFQACGGSLDGPWDLKAQCLGPSEELACEFPFDQEKSCQSEANTVRCHWDGTGRITFAEKTAHLQRQAAIVARYTLTEDCTAAVRPEAGDAAARCGALSRPPLMTCSLDEDLCVCHSRVVDEPREDLLPYSVKGSRIQFGEFQADYCAGKDQLILDFEPHPASWKYWVLQKVPGSGLK